MGIQSTSLYKCSSWTGIQTYTTIPTTIFHRFVRYKRNIGDHLSQINPGTKLLCDEHGVFSGKAYTSSFSYCPDIQLTCINNNPTVTFWIPFLYNCILHDLFSSYYIIYNTSTHIMTIK